MTDEQNANELRKYYLTHKPRKRVKNVCQALPKWNGCDYCDIYSGKGLDCWKQDGKHDCCHCMEVEQ